MVVVNPGIADGDGDTTAPVKAPHGRCLEKGDPLGCVGFENKVRLDADNVGSALGTFLTYKLLEPQGRC
jgi:hypothetical protein